MKSQHLLPVVVWTVPWTRSVEPAASRDLSVLWGWGCNFLRKRPLCLLSVLLFAFREHPPQLPAGLSPLVWDSSSNSNSLLLSQPFIQAQFSFDLADPFHPCGCRWTQKRTALWILPDHRDRHPISPNPKLKLWHEVQNAFRGDNLWKPQEIWLQLLDWKCQGKFVLGQCFSRISKLFLS